MKKNTQVPSLDKSLLEQLTFEKAFSQLEEIVTTLETEEKSLEDALALFERGQALAHRCALLLDQAELKVKQLTGDVLTDFNQKIESSNLDID